MTQVLVKWEGNWADEMDIEGWSVVSKEKWENYRRFLQNHDKEFTFYVGTNEEIEYSDGSELLRELKAIEITDAEAQVLNNLFGGEYGFTCFLEVQEDLDDEDDDEDDE